MILGETILFIFCMIITGLLLFLLVYFVITLSDLECDYINAQQCCYRLNMWSVPKLCGQGIVTLFLLLHGWHWLFAANLPVLVWSIYELMYVPTGNIGVYDPMEIHNRGQLKIHMRDVLIKLGFYLIAFFIYLYCMIVSMIKSDPVPVTPMPNDFNDL